MDILFENNSIAVCIKPAGVSSQESNGKNMVTMLEEATEIAEIYPVHRLDIKTSGVMVYAKTKSAAAFLSREITEGRFIKEYKALIHGIPEDSSGTMEDFLFFDRRKNKSYVVKKERKGVKKAILDYDVIKSGTSEKGQLSLVKIKLHTGRTHQIRVQFASRKMPVYGDGKYGASDNVPFTALRSSRITFINPEDGKELSFSAPPASWENIINF